jgi:hypothetical protein
MVAVWRFQTESCRVRFAIRLDNKLVSDEKVRAVAWLRGAFLCSPATFTFVRKVDASRAVVCGRLRLPSAASTCSLVFDNSSSWTQTKIVLYSAELVDSEAVEAAELMAMAVAPCAAGTSAFVD